MMSELDQTNHLNKNVSSELARLLYAGSKYRPCLHIISAIFMLSIIAGDVSLLYVIAWTVTLAVINVYRFIDIKNTQLILDKVKDFRPLQRRFALSATLLGLTYGLGATIIFTQLTLIDQMYIICLIAILMPAGLVSFASDKYSFYGFLSGLCLPLTIRILLMGEMPYISIGIYSIIYIAICRKLFIWNHEALKNSIELKYKNIQLLESLRETNALLKQQNMIDELTKVSNRRHLDEVLEKEWLRAKRIRSSLALLMIDIDFFKQYNDTFGHLKGDECLKHIATVLSNNLNRPGDFVARFGGEEFCILMPETDLDGAITFAEKIHSTIIELKIDNPDSEVSKYLTISIGIATIIPNHGDSYMDLIYTSDKALYKAKKDGRNIIRMKETLERNPKPKLVI